VLGWTDAARDLQQRAAFAGRHRPQDDWPDVDDAALVRDLDEWLAPELRARRVAGRAGLEAIDMTRVLRDRLGHHRLRRLDDAVPRSLALAGGRTVPVHYDGDGGRPTVRVKVQDAFGTGVTPGSHPTAAGEAIVFELLSPAGRPVQVTADLPGFWQGSWAAVRKEMAGRYPKHAWPADPTTNAGRR
jgi:ATP-dependent helicase HrpB